MTQYGGSYHLGIDLGTSFTAAALCRPGRSRGEAVMLGGSAPTVPSVVFADRNGRFLTGTAALRRATSDPGRVVSGFKRRIGDPTPLLVDGVAVTAEELAGRFIAGVVADVAAREGGPAASIAVTHPAAWGPHRLASLRAALARHGLASALLLAEPQAAAVGYSSAERIEAGAVVAVYDLGGGTFDAAVVRKPGDGGFELLGRPVGIDPLGGLDFDDAVFAHVRAAVGTPWDGLDPADPAVLAAVGRLRRECVEAKEGLSADGEVVIPVVLPGITTEVRLRRGEFEEMIRPALGATVDAVRRTVDSAGVADGELDAVLLVGGSSRIPLVAQLISAEFGRQPAVDADPKGVIAAGAAIAARAAAAPRAGGVPGRAGGTAAAAGRAGGPVGGPDPAAVTDPDTDPAGAPASRSAPPARPPGAGSPGRPPLPSGPAAAPQPEPPPRSAVAPPRAGEEHDGRSRAATALVVGLGLLLVLLTGGIITGYVVHVANTAGGTPAVATTPDPQPATGSASPAATTARRGAAPATGSPGAPASAPATRTPAPAPARRRSGTAPSGPTTTGAAATGGQGAAAVAPAGTRTGQPARR